jgi:hypothetical protein
MSLLIQYNKNYIHKIPKYLPLKIKLDNIYNNLDIINQKYDYIELNNETITLLNNVHKIKLEKIYYNKIEICNHNILKNNNFESMLNIISHNIDLFINFNNIFTQNILCDLNNKNINIIKKIFFYKKYNVIHLYNDDNLIIIIHNFVIIYNKNNNLLLLNNVDLSHVYIISTDIETKNRIISGKIFDLNYHFKYNDNKKMIYGYYKNQFIKSLLNYTEDCNNNSILNIKYNNTKNNINYKEYKIDKNNGDIINIINKNGLIIERYYNYVTNIENIISYCMMDGTSNGNELRYRGKYTEEKKDDKTINKRLTINDSIEYDESEGKVLVDKIRNIDLKSVYIIGWKVAKNENGDLRIIKLCINDDSIIVIPINEEYLLYGKKERCNYAIVLDIQMPILEEEITVVPDELIAYSFIYDKNETKFEYYAGKEVFPDTFNEDQNIGCGNGIHYYRDKNDLFEYFINKN